MIPFNVVRSPKISTLDLHAHSLTLLLALDMKEVKHIFTMLCELNRGVFR